MPADKPSLAEVAAKATSILRARSEPNGGEYYDTSVAWAGDISEAILALLPVVEAAQAGTTN